MLSATNPDIDRATGFRYAGMQNEIKEVELAPSFSRLSKEFAKQVRNSLIWKWRNGEGCHWRVYKYVRLA